MKSKVRWNMNISLILVHVISVKAWANSKMTDSLGKRFMVRGKAYVQKFKIVIL